MTLRPHQGSRVHYHYEWCGAHRILLRQTAGEQTTEEGRALAALALVSPGASCLDRICRAHFNPSDYNDAVTLNHKNLHKFKFGKRT